MCSRAGSTKLSLLPDGTIDLGIIYSTSLYPFSRTLKSVAVAIVTLSDDFQYKKVLFGTQKLSL